VAGVEYGVGAIGGVVRVVPRELPEAPGIGGLVQANVFSNSRQGAGSLLVEGATAAVPGLGWRLQGSLRRAGDARAPAYGLANTGVFERTASVSAGLHRRAWGFDLHASHFGTTLGVYGGAHVASPEALRQAIAAGRPREAPPFSYRIEAPRQEVRHDLATAEGHLVSGRGDRLELRYGFQRNHRQEYDRHFRFQTTPEGTLAFDLTLVTHTLDLRLRHRPVRGFVGVLGFSGMNQANENGAAGQLIPNFRALTGGAFLRETYVSGPLRLEGGLRYDVRDLTAYPRDRAAGAFVETQTTERALTAALGAIYGLGRGFTVAANAASAWRPPSVNELYAYGVHHGTAQFEVGDPSLQAEHSRGLDATLRYARARVRGEVSVYRTAFDGFLYLAPDTALVTTIRGAFPLRSYVSTDARLVGVDGEVEADVLHALTLHVGGAIVRGDDTARGEPLYGMPADRLTAGATMHLHGGRRVRQADLEAAVHLVARQRRVPSLPDFAPPPPGYARLDLGVRATLRLAGHDVITSLTVENVLDTAYRDYLSRYRFLADDPGRNVAFRVAVPFGAYRL
jgi:iron complex outermembrane recepter protein